MADISKITLPSGTTYNFKDAEARKSIEALAKLGLVIEKVTTLPTASADTMGKIYIVAHAHTTGDGFDEFITVKGGTESAPTYAWEKIGTTDIDLSGYAQKGDGVTGSGSAANAKTGITVAKPSVTNGSMTVSGKFTPAGTISTGSGTANYTPAGSVGTPTITVTPSTVTKYVAGSASGGGSVTAGKAASFTNGTLASFGTSVANETLTLSWTAPTADTFTANTPTAVTLPSFTSQTIATGISSASSTKPSFTGTGVELKFSGTQGDISASGNSNVSLGNITVTDPGHTHTVSVTGTIDN